jgi:hypothetical protein
VKTDLKPRFGLTAKDANLRQGLKSFFNRLFSCPSTDGSLIFTDSRKLNSLIAGEQKSLKAFQMQEELTAKLNSKLAKILNLQSQNRGNFVQNENQEERLVTISKISGAIPVWCGGVAGHNSNHERGHSQERVLEDGISHGSRFVRQLTDQISPVLNAFYNPCKSVVKTVFSLFVLIRVHSWLKMVLNCVDQCKFAPLQPPAKQKWLCLFYSSSLKAPLGFAKISGFKFCEIPCVPWFKTVFTLPFSLPLPWRLISAFKQSCKSCPSMLKFAISPQPSTPQNL